MEADSFDTLKERTEEKIKVMQAFVDGKTIQHTQRHGGKELHTTYAPCWNWENYEYVVKEGNFRRSALDDPFAEDNSESDPHKEVKMFGLYQCAVRIDDVVRIDTEWDGENHNLVIYQKSVKEPLTVRYRSHEECEKVYLKLLEACNSKK